MKKIFLFLCLCLLIPAIALGLTATATGSGNIAESVDPGKAFYLVEVRLHLSAAGAANDLTVTLDALAGAGYDVVLLTQDMTTVTDLVWRPDQPAQFVNGDKIVIAWTNGSSRTYGLEVIWR